MAPLMPNRTYPCRIADPFRWIEIKDIPLGIHKALYGYPASLLLQSGIETNRADIVIHSACRLAVKVAGIAVNVIFGLLHPQGRNADLAGGGKSADINWPVEAPGIRKRDHIASHRRCHEKARYRAFKHL